MLQTTDICVKLLLNVAYQKLSKSANVSRSYSKNKSGTVFLDMVYINEIGGNSTAVGLVCTKVAALSKVAKTRK